MCLDVKIPGVGSGSRTGSPRGGAALPAASVVKAAGSGCYGCRSTQLVPETIVVRCCLPSEMAPQPSHRLPGASPDRVTVNRNGCPTVTR